MEREYDEIRRRKRRDFRNEDRTRRKLYECRERMSCAVEKIARSNYEEIDWVQFARVNTELHIYFGRGHIGCRPHGHIVINLNGYVILYCRSIYGAHGCQNLVRQTIAN